MLTDLLINCSLHAQVPCHRFRQHRRQPLDVAAKTDYAATAADASVLQQPLKNELTAVEIKHVFGYSNALKDRYCCQIPKHCKYHSRLALAGQIELCSGVQRPLACTALAEPAWLFGQVQNISRAASALHFLGLSLSPTPLHGSM